MSADSTYAAATPGAAGPAAAGNGGVIHNIGYRAYDGPRLGRRQIILALCWHSLRSAFGIGRGIKAKIVPVITFVIMCLPAIVNAAAVALNPSHQRIVSYGVYTPALRILVLLVFVASQAPELVSRDLRSHSLPLYFARPIRRLDYPAAKLAGFVLACLAMIEIPLLLLYLGTVTQEHTGHAIWTQTKGVLLGLAIGVLWAVLLAAIGLFLASLSGRRAFATGAIAIFLLLTLTLAQLLTQIGQNVVGKGSFSGTPPPLVGLSGLISPFTDLDGLRLWLGGTTAGEIPNPGHYGPLYGLMFLVFLGAAVGGLVARYRKVGVA
jgi:ABC-2 type transport system permease protein